MSKKAVILGSGIGLGFYLPGMVIQSQLQEMGYETKYFVFENLLIDKKKNNINKIKEFFQKSYSVALAGQKIVHDVDDAIDRNKYEQVLNYCMEHKINKVICFSGFWMPFIRDFYSKYQNDIMIDYCHVDVIESVSWKMYMQENDLGRHVYFNNWAKKDIDYLLNISQEEPLEYQKRENRLSVHGGGWSIGDFFEKAQTLNKEGFELDITINNLCDTNLMEGNNKYYKIKDNWSAWDYEEFGEHTFPPFAEYLGCKTSVYNDNGKYPLVYDMIKRNKAIISKPGGGTLIDSFSAATPLVYLKPYGYYEEKNGQLWEELGFGLSFEKWKQTNFSIEELEKCYINIINKRKNTINYVKEYVKCNQ